MKNTANGNWIDLSKQKPEPNSRVLVCDENGYMAIENTKDGSHYGYPRPGVFGGRVPTFEELWMNGNGTKLVAWMPLPDYPEQLCNTEADGGMP